MATDPTTGFDVHEVDRLLTTAEHRCERLDPSRPVFRVRRS
jgi:hypothetical protein